MRSVLPMVLIAGLALVGAVGCSSDNGDSDGDGGAAGAAAYPYPDGGGVPTTDLDEFSFFVTSLEGLQRLSGSQTGFGGDLRYGEADGLSGADKICTQIAEYSMAGAGQKGWRAFLSVTAGPDASPVHAIDRIGQGPWYDRLGRLVAMNLDDLANERPVGADPAIINDLPNEYGVPNHAPDPEEGEVDNHDMLTGSDDEGRLYDDEESTCQDWTSSVGSDGRPRCGHSWPRDGGGGRPGGDDGGGMAHWISALDEAGCAPGVSLVESGGPDPSNPTVGSGGGYGGFYCFALVP